MAKTSDLNLREEALYPHVSKWLKEVLRSKFKRATIEVYDTSNLILRNFLIDHGYTKYFKDFLTYEISVDIFGIVLVKRGAFISLIECKIKPITLRDISQLLGYSRVCAPLISIVLSPAGISTSVNYLLNVYQRYDVLRYNKNGTIRVANWDINRKDIDYQSIIPPGPLT